MTGSPISKHGVEVGKKSPPVHKKIDTPKSSSVGELAESGYMADTDEPRRHQKKVVAGMESKPTPISLPCTPADGQKPKEVAATTEKKQAASVNSVSHHHKSHHHVVHKPHKKPVPLAAPQGNRGTTSTRGKVRHPSNTLQPVLNSL